MRATKSDNTCSSFFFCSHNLGFSHSYSFSFSLPHTDPPPHPPGLKGTPSGTIPEHSDLTQLPPAPHPTPTPLLLFNPSPLLCDCQQLPHVPAGICTCFTRPQPTWIQLPPPSSFMHPLPFCHRQQKAPDQSDCQLVIFFFTPPPLLPYTPPPQSTYFSTLSLSPPHPPPQNTNSSLIHLLLLLPIDRSLPIHSFSYAFVKKNEAATPTFYKSFSFEYRRCGALQVTPHCARTLPAEREKNLQFSLLFVKPPPPHPHPPAK